MAKNEKRVKYWAERAIRAEQTSSDLTEDLIKELLEAYNRAAKEMSNRIYEFYGKYSKTHGVSFDDAEKILTAYQQKAWQADIKEYLQAIRIQIDPDVKRQMRAAYDALSYSGSITRLQALQYDIRATTFNLYQDMAEKATRGFTGVYENSYYRNMYDLQERVGRLLQSDLDPKLIQEVLAYPWDGKNFNQTLWKNTTVLAYNAEREVANGIIQGLSAAQVSKKLSDVMGSGYKMTERVVRTEGSYFHGEAAKRVYVEAQVAKYEFMATLSERTCPVCGGLDGKTFDVDKAQPGENYNPMHPNCRCTTVAYDPEEAQDWADIGEPMPERMTYSEWMKRQKNN